MAKHLLEILGGNDDAAEGFGGPHQIQLPGKIAVGGDQIVAEQIDLAGDEPAGFVEPADGHAKAVDAAFALGVQGISMQGGADASEKFVGGERLGEEIDRAVRERRHAPSHAGGAGDDDRAGQRMMFSQRGHIRAPSPSGRFKSTISRSTA